MSDLDRLLHAARRDVLEEDAVARVRFSVTASSFSFLGAKKALFAKLAAATVGIGAIAVTVWSSSPPSMATDPSVSPVRATDETTLPALPVPRETVAPAVTAPPIETVHDVKREPPSPREGLLLLRARQKLESDPRAARELVRQHRLEFPNSQLAPERDKIAKDAEAILQR